MHLEDCGERPPGRERGKEYSRVKAIQVCNICTYEENKVNPIQHCLKKVGRGKKGM
jgi:hypothetical protein